MGGTSASASAEVETRQDATAEAGAASTRRSTSAPSVSGWMLVVVISVALYGVFVRDHIPVAGGLGYDGEVYGLIALQPEHIFNLPFNRVQRCLPSLLVHLAIRGLDLAPNARSVVAVFSAMNASLLLAGLWIWLRIAARLRLQPPSTIFGFCGLFLSFAGATMPYYYPVLTDTWALFLGLLLAWLYVCGSGRGLLGVFLLSGLVWPSLMYFMLPLLLFPLGRGPIPRLRNPAWRDRIALAAAVLSVAAVGWAQPLGGWADPIDGLLPLSVVVLAAYVFVGTRVLLKAGSESLSSLDRADLRSAALRAFGLAAVFVLLQSTLAAFFFQPTEYWQRPVNFAAQSLKSSVIAPGAFLVGHAANFGILFLFVVGFWRRVCAVAAEMGLGAWLFLAGCLAFSVNAESRHSNALWPMLVMLVCTALDRLEWPRPWLLVVCSLSLLNSRALVLLNWDFPRLYFANFPLTMDPVAYAVQALGFTAIAACLYLLWLVTRRVPSRPEPSVPNPATRV